ncbi:hypothetical protein GCM10009557_00710 [Virgisporangium ochraceum]|uniref:Uncharacterized protein n=1 Tax=Virgisporangium ochraceum TaxID=65505 RepID=A0A8J4A3G1_9ACTN|nr:hypothetical protein Voc01_090200 [Virgisporangium ochraceum]
MAVESNVEPCASGIFAGNLRRILSEFFKILLIYGHEFGAPSHIHHAVSRINELGIGEMIQGKKTEYGAVVWTFHLLKDGVIQLWLDEVPTRHYHCKNFAFGL